MSARASESGKRKKGQKLWVHDDAFSLRDLIVSEAAFPRLKSGDIIGLYQPECEHSTCHVLLQVQHGSKPLQRGGQISVHKRVAEYFNLQNLRAVEVYAVPDPSQVTAATVELSIRGQYIGRSDMWRVKQRLKNSCLFESKQVEFAGMRAKVSDIWLNGSKVSSAYFGVETKVVFRSSSTQLYLLFQMSQEMWDFDWSGDLYLEKAVSFCTQLFEEWAAVGAAHQVTVILFTRVAFDATVTQADFEDGTEGLLEGADGCLYQDYFQVVTEKDTRSSWTAFVLRLKSAFQSFGKALDHLLETGRPKAQISKAEKGNFLEAINLCLDCLESHYIDRNFERTGLCITVVTPSVGFFDVNELLLNSSEQRAIDEGIAVDLISLASPPFHLTPLMRLDKSAEFLIPFWIHHLFYLGPDKPLVDAASDTLVHMRVPISQWISQKGRTSEQGQARTEAAMIAKTQRYEDYDRTVWTTSSEAPPDRKRRDELKTPDDLISRPEPATQRSAPSSPNQLKRRNFPTAPLGHALRSPKRQSFELNSWMYEEVSDSDEELHTLMQGSPIPKSFGSVTGLMEQASSGELVSSLGHRPGSSLWFNHGAPPPPSISVAPSGDTEEQASIRRTRAKPFRMLYDPPWTPNLRRWAHVYPLYFQDASGLVLTSVSSMWKSICQPACLPLTTDYLPAMESLLKTHKISSSYSMMFIGPWDDRPLSETNEQSLARLYNLLVGQRLAQGFQICMRPEAREPAFEEQTPHHSIALSMVRKSNAPRKSSDTQQELWMSLGQRFHRVVKDESTNSVLVTIYGPKEAPDERDEKYNYSYTFFHPTRKPVVIHTTFSSAAKQVYGWNAADNLLSMPLEQDDPLDLENVVQPLHFWRARYVIYSKEPPDADTVERFAKLLQDLNRIISATQAKPTDMKDPRSSVSLAAAQAAAVSGHGIGSVQVSQQILVETADGDADDMSAVAGEVLSRIVYVDMDQKRQSDRDEWGAIYFDSHYRSGRCFHIEFDYYVATGCLVKGIVDRVKNRAESHGFRFVPVPIDLRPKTNPQPFHVQHFIPMVNLQLGSAPAEGLSASGRETELHRLALQAATQGQQQQQAQQQQQQRLSPAGSRTHSRNPSAVTIASASSEVFSASSATAPDGANRRKGSVDSRATSASEKESIELNARRQKLQYAIARRFGFIAHIVVNPGREAAAGLFPSPERTQYVQMEGNFVLEAYEHGFAWIRNHLIPDEGTIEANNELLRKQMKQLCGNEELLSAFWQAFQRAEGEGAATAFFKGPVDADVARADGLPRAASEEPS